MVIWERIKYEYSKGNSAIRQIIIINLGVFILSVLLAVAGKLMVFESSEILQYFYLPSDLSTLVFRPWTLLTNIFLHSGFRHIFWNLLMLYFIGRILEDYLSREKLDEFSGIQDELVELYRSGELEDIDEDLYSEIKYQIDEKYGEYQDGTGVMRSFELFVDREAEKIQLIAKIDIDPEYENIKEKKDVELNFSEVDKAKEIIQNMANWLNGDVYL